MRVFFDKGCSRCHAVLGEGGKSAPDLARAPVGQLSAAEVLAAMWNHAPSMWEKMRQEKVPSPSFNKEEMANLFAFLYSVRSLDVPGDAERGRRLLTEKRCLRCHAVGGQGGRRGPDLERWASYRNPVSWIQTMWNHGPAMREAMGAQGLPWPQFQGDDVADLIAYVRQLAPNPRRKVYLRSADPQAGRVVFQHKGCSSCHALRGRGGTLGPDLAKSVLPRTLGQFAADMWNHGPTMWSSMGSGQLRARQFSNKEMADLIAYLFAERYFEVAGEPRRGQRLFQEKGCAGCHTGGTAPDLTGWAAASPSALATDLWNHGPLMFQTMQEQRKEWPVFRPGEMVDLIEFLSRGPAQAPSGGQR
ncbi:MAG TPA: c-type cytochrome [Terriglobales bacterium]|nr:c-type cytochrome [Terriglobales bacterium]